MDKCDKGENKMLTSLRRHYPDQVLRVFLSNTFLDVKHPGNFASDDWVEAVQR